MRRPEGSEEPRPGEPSHITIDHPLQVLAAAPPWSQPGHRSWTTYCPAAGLVSGLSGGSQTVTLRASRPHPVQEECGQQHPRRGTASPIPALSPKPHPRGQICVSRGGDSRREPLSGPAGLVQAWEDRPLEGRASDTFRETFVTWLSGERGGHSPRRGAATWSLRFRVHHYPP